MADTRVDILIVGAGLAGASTAYHLKRSSDLRILVVEKESTPGVHSSGRNASYVRERMENPVLQPIATAGAAFLRGGTLVPYGACGAMLLGLGEQDVRRFFPVARGRGLWCPNDGTVDVAGLLHAYLSGQDVRYETEVIDWTREGDGLIVRTNRGALTCGLIVNATGPWAGSLGHLPLTPMGRHIFVTPPMEWVDPTWPFIWDVDGGLYFRPESGGLLFCACDERPSEPGDYSEDPAVLESLAEKLARLQPELSGVSIQHSWVGQRVFAEDRRFVIGFDPRDDRLFHVAGLGGHGVTTSYVVGRIAAKSILGRNTDYGDVFAPSRLL